MHWLRTSVTLLYETNTTFLLHVHYGLYKLRYTTKGKGASLDILLNTAQEKYVMTGICLWDFWALPAQEST